MHPHDDHLLTMGVCPRCGQAFSFSEAELVHPLRLGGGLYLEGHCAWCDVRAIVPVDQTFILAPDRPASLDG